MAEGGGRQQELSRAERAAGGAGRRAGAPRPQLPELLSNAGSADAARKAQTRAERGSRRDDLGTLPPAVLWREGTKAGSREVKCVQHKTEPVTELAVLGPGPG